MPRVPIATENRTGEGGDRFPKVKLTEKGQKVRFTVIEVPWREYVHFLKSPEFDDHGHPKKETKTKRDGTAYEDIKLVFEGSPICLGDEAVLREKGLDEKNCPACAASVASGETKGLPGPVSRFAVNVVEYALHGNTWNIRKPFTAEIKIWTFTGRMYDEIEAIQQEIGDLRHHDLTLECEDPYWQRNKLAFKMESGFAQGDKAYLRELLTTPGNKATDAQLRDACGREVPRARMADDCEYVMRQWRKLRNEGQETPYGTGSSGSLDGGLDDLLNEEETGTASTGNVLDGTGTDPFAEFAAETTSNPSPAAVASRNAAASASAGPSAGPGSAATPATKKAAPRSSSKAEPAEEAEVPDAVDDFLDAPETGVTRERPAAQEAAAPADDFDFDDLMQGI